MDRPNLAVYFDNSRPAPKVQFLNAFEETTFLAQLLTAPFGLPYGAADILGKELLVDEYTVLYCSWEDLFSRLIYAKRGIPDDRVAATIHRYIEVKKDQRVLDAIQEASSAMNSLVEPPKCLELPIQFLSSEVERNNSNMGEDVEEGSSSDLVNTPKTAATLLNQVIQALQSAVPYAQETEEKVISNSAHHPSHPLSPLRSAFERSIDPMVLAHLDISVPIRLMSPSMLGTAAFAPCCLSTSSVEELKNALHVTIDIDDGQTITRKFSLQQYYSLLEIFRESPEVTAVLAERCEGISKSAKSLEDLQNGALELVFAVHPTVSYVLQLKSIIAKSNETDRVTTAVCALARVSGALRARAEAADAVVIGDMRCAIESLTEALEREYSPAEDEEAEIEGEEGGMDEEDKKIVSESVLPLYIKVQILMDRAECYLEAGMKKEALDDCNAVLAIDNRCVAAYALRSKLSPAAVHVEEDEEEENYDIEKKEGEAEGQSEREMLQNGVSDVFGNRNVEDHSKTGNESVSIVKKADQLTAAATDALAAFLVGGSTNLMFASAAEEAARESCRISAKRIFAERGNGEELGKGDEMLHHSSERRDVTGIEKTAQSNDEVVKEIVSEVKDDVLPRAWLVQSFFAGYEPLRTAFGMETAQPDEEEFEADLENEGVNLKETVRLLYTESMAAAEADIKASGILCRDDVDGDDENGKEVVVNGEREDIDEGNTNRSASTSSTRLPHPPIHFIDSSASLSSSPSSSSSSRRPLDSLGYWALRSLVCKLESTQHPNEEELAIVQASEERKISEGYIEELGSWMGEAERMWKELCAEEEEEKNEEEGGDDGVDMVRAADQRISEAEVEAEGRSASRINLDSIDIDEIREEREDKEKKVDEEYFAMMKKLNLLSGEDSDKHIGFSLGLKMGGRGSIHQSSKSVLSVQRVQPPPSVYVPVDVNPVYSTAEFEENIRIVTQESPGFLAHGNYSISAGIGRSGCVASPKTTPQGSKKLSTTILSPLAPPCSAFKWCLELLLLPEIAIVTGVTFNSRGMVLSIDPLRELNACEGRNLEAREKEEKEEKEMEMGKGKQDAIEEEELKGFFFDSARHQRPRRSKMDREEEEEEEEGEWEDCGEDDEGDEGGEWEDCDDDEDEEEGESLGKGGGDGEREAAYATKEDLNFISQSVSSMKFDDPEKIELQSSSTLPSVPVPVPVPLPPSPSPSPAPLFTPICTAVPLPHAPVPATASSSKETTIIPHNTVVPTNFSSSSSSPSSSSSHTVAASVTIIGDDASVLNSVLPSPPSPLSRSLHARLLSVCSSIAYLSGDAMGAVRCLRASVREDYIAAGGLVDSSVKLGSLLIDMDELAEASMILDRISEENPKKAIILLHRAELEIHKSEFHSSVALLKKAQKLMQVNEIVSFAPNSQDFREFDTRNLTSEAITLKRNRRKIIIEKRRQLCKSTERQLSANIFALLGVAQFRCAPSSPEISLRTLQEGIVKYPESLYLLLCTGEIISQTGDTVKAIKCFKKASKLNPFHPLPYVNAARTYVQLNQSRKALAHLSFAISLDENLASTRVDLSQIYLLSGKTKLALDTLELALNMSKHVSEIRDVLTALKIANIQSKLQEEGIYLPPADVNSFRL